MKSMAISEARDKLMSLHGDLKREVLAVTNRNKPVLAVMDWELYEAITETLEIMGNPDLMAKLQKSLREAAEGELIPFEEVAKELG